MASNEDERFEVLTEVVTDGSEVAVSYTNLREEEGNRPRVIARTVSKDSKVTVEILEAQLTSLAEAITLSDIEEARKGEALAEVSEIEKGLEDLVRTKERIETAFLKAKSLARGAGVVWTSVERLIAALSG